MGPLPYLQMYTLFSQQCRATEDFYENKAGGRQTRQAATAVVYVPDDMDLNSGSADENAEAGSVGLGNGLSQGKGEEEDWGQVLGFGAR